MKLSIDIRPTKISAPSKAQIVQKVVEFGGLWSMSGVDRCQILYGRVVSYRAIRQPGVDGNFILVNYEKHRPKFRSNPLNGGKKTKIREGRWDAYVYVVPARLVKYAFQNKRNFTLVVG